MRGITKAVAVTLPVLLSIYCSQGAAAAQCKSAVNAGTAFSVKTDVKAAVDEAADALKKQLGKKPEFVALYYTVGYDPAAVLKEVHKKFGKKVKIFGGSSCVGVFDNAGFHKGEKDSLSMMGISSKKITFGVGSSTLANTDAVQAGKLAIYNAMLDAGKSGQKPDAVLLISAPGTEEAVISGIESVIGQVPIIGGSSADNTITGNWTQIANNETYAKGVVIAAVYTKLKIGTSFQSGYEVISESGYEATSVKGTVTKANGRDILEIDNRPAAVVYNEWLSGALSDKLATGGMILADATFHPLAHLIDAGNNVVYALSMHPASINLPAQSISLFANIATGDKIELMKGDAQRLINRGTSTPSLALENGAIDQKDVAFGMFIYCAGTMLALPDEGKGQVSTLANKVLGDKPFIGFYPFGEQGYVFGIGNIHGNLSSSMIVFSEKEKEK